MSNIVNNIEREGALPEITTQIASTPKQIYRNTADKYFEPLLMVLTNQDGTSKQLVRFVDADLTDEKEDTYKSEAYTVYRVTVPVESTVILEDKHLLGLRFRYGICAYNLVSKDAGKGVQIYVAGGEQ